MLRSILLISVMAASVDVLAAAPKCSSVFKETKVANPEAIESGKRIKNYFSAVQEQMVEREYVVKALLNAMIAKEHLLMVGPPGNAKTTLTKLVFENIKEKSTGKISFFATQMTSETSLSDTHGGINYKTLQETGKQDRLYEEGILGARVAMLDEQFDMRPNGYRNILDVLAERAHAQGGKKHKGKTWTVVGASNTFIPDVYAKFDGNEQPRALIDRYAYVLFIPAEMEKNSSNRLIVQGSQKERKALPEVYFEDFENVQKLVSQVEIPNYISDLINLLHYRLRTVFESKEEASLQEYKEKVLAGEKPLPPYKSTKYLSPRTLGKAAGVVRASVAFDYVNNNGQRRLSVQVKDLDELVNFYSLGGPSDKFIQNQISRASKEVEKEQLKTILWERKVVRETLNNILTEYNQKLTGMGSQDLHAKVRDYQNLKPNEKRELMDMLRAMYVRSREIANMDQDAISPELIAEVSVGELVPKWVNTINPDKAKDIIASWDKSAPITKNKNSAHRYDAVVEGQGSIKEIVKRVDGKATEVQATEIHDSGKAQPVTTVSSQTKVPVNESYTADLVKLKVKNQMTTDSNPNVLRDYLDNGFDPNAIVFESDKEKWTALGLAAYFGAKEKVAMLLKYGADPAQLSRKGENNRTAIDWARSQNNSPNNGEVVRMIEEHMAKQSSASSAPPAKIQKKYDQAYTQNMINSMISGKMHVADTILPFKTMLDNGFDPNAYVFYTISEKWTALASAAYQGQIETVKLLLDHGADPLKRQMSKEISYDVIQLTKTSPNSPNKEEIIRLLQNQVDKIKTEAQNLTPIERARLKSYDEKYTAELSGYFDDKFRALDRVNFESFLKNGFNPNATIFNKHGEKWTAIGAAAWGGNINTVKILLEHGADPTVRCSTRYEDMDALGWAKDQGRTEVVKVLDEYYKKYNLQK